MTTATDIAAVQLLEEWVTGNGLASKYDTYVNTQIRTGDSFYTKLLTEKGQTAAEEALREWNTRSRMSDFAAGIEPVAQGMLALARVDTEGKYAMVVDVDEHAPFPHCYDISGPSKMIVVFNQQAPGCGCNQPIGSDAFAPYGRLGLNAVTLQVSDGRRYGNTAAQLGLVLPQRALDPKDMDKDAYTVAAIELNGFITGHTYTPGFYKNGYLRYALGLIELDRAVGCWQASGGHFDDALGFPGATDYLADALPKLGEYFTALAERLDSDHKH
ncbi:MAG TPA: hypothetical protein VK963_04745 [Candidatus Saccharimonadales bacterium]|nr:hypothetical protein [Candidatus Saccharimonadales bacterium]